MPRIARSETPARVAQAEMACATASGVGNLGGQHARAHARLQGEELDAESSEVEADPGAGNQTGSHERKL
jgi:hypothetical protein